MSYSTAADIEHRLGAEAYLRLFDRDGDGAADPQLVDEAIAHADAMINVELRGVFTLPLPSPTATYVKDIAVDLAIGRTARGTPYGVANPSLSALYDNAEKRLHRLRAIGGAQLADSEGTREAIEFVVSDPRRPRL